ncbi:hypothetical protein ES319_A05G021300v1 [Gossypium barbadense]|uniref:Uncharacterized protein n=1 Tax=Gossypium barbadense TaxID=3634 RepID=A0A5J5VJ21_GOSBA|nr:hypothetical protein ES319_A05G021300v1 [Gossypium barbadense]
MLGTWSCTRQHSLWSLFHTLRVAALWPKEAIHHLYQDHPLCKHFWNPFKPNTSYGLNNSTPNTSHHQTRNPLLSPFLLRNGSSTKKMSPFSKVVASSCKKHVDGDYDDNDGFDYAPIACMEGNGDDDDDDDYDYAPAASLDGDDDDDSYDYAPAA